MSIRLIRACLLVALPLFCTAHARGDVVRLRSGGAIRGEVDPASLDRNATHITVQTLSGTRITVAREDVEDITQRTMLAEQYETLARRVADTVEAHWTLAEWCRQNRLTAQRHEQLELLLDLDPDHEEARRILGHVQHNGRWLTREEWMQERGYVRHEGKWVTQQELDLILKSDAERAAEAAWYPKVRLWFTWASGRHEQRQLDGMTNLEEITDPDAVPALVNFMGDHENDAVRLMCVRVLGRMNGPKPVAALTRHAMFDDNEDVRKVARDGVDPSQYELALNYYVPELRNESNPVVRRAAEAIREIDDINTVPYLIAALVTEHKWKIQVPANNSVSFGQNSAGQLGMMNSLSGNLPAEVELLTRTGQLPYGAIVIPPPGQRQTRTVTIKGDVRNPEVLDALQAITGQNFGYSKGEWQEWWATRLSS